MIKEITNTVLLKALIEDKKNKQVKNNLDSVELALSGEFSVNSLIQYNNEERNLYSSQVEFTLIVLESNLGNIPISEIDEDDMYLCFHCQYKIDFIVNDLNEENKKELSKELGHFVAPYIKELVANLFNRTEFPIPPVPLSMFENLKAVE